MVIVSTQKRRFELSVCGPSRDTCFLAHRLVALLLLLPCHSEDRAKSSESGSFETQCAGPSLRASLDRNSEPSPQRPGPGGGVGAAAAQSAS